MDAGVLNDRAVSSENDVEEWREGTVLEPQSNAITRVVEGGYGSCRSCNCTGYKKSKGGDQYCTNPNCGHHFDQHRD